MSSQTLSLTDVLEGISNINSNMANLEQEIKMNQTHETLYNDIQDPNENPARVGVEQEIEEHETLKLSRVDAELSFLAAIDEFLLTHSKGELRFFVEENL